MSSTQKILVVGAGALGLTTGYFLQRGGAAVEFLARPHRADDLARPQQLFDYRTGENIQFSNFGVHTDPNTAVASAPDWIFFTLDGALARSDQACQTLASLGQVVANANTRWVICGVGVGLREHIVQNAGLKDDNVYQGTMRAFAYQTQHEGTPQPASEHVSHHNQADIAFAMPAAGPGFFLGSESSACIDELTATFERGGMGCALLAPHLYSMGTNLFFSFTVAAELDGWRGIDDLVANKPLWRACCKSQREIMRLSQWGLTGKIAALVSTNKKIRTQLIDNETAMRPMDFMAFNRFHHGGKVVEQDTQILQRCIDIGVSEGRSMTASRWLLDQWKARHRSPE